MVLGILYNKAFTACFDQDDLMVGEGKAALDGDSFGKQNLEFTGIQFNRK